MSSMLRHVPRRIGTSRKRRLVVAAAAVVSVLVLASPASAGGSLRTFHTTFTDSGSFTDDGATAACGFPVTFTYDTRVVLNAQFDESGNFIQAEFLPNGTATESANGITLTGQIEDNMIIFTRTQQVYEVGLVDVLKLPGGGVVQIDVGRIVSSFDGAIIVVEGPHQSLEGDDAALCAALTP